MKRLMTIALAAALGVPALAEPRPVREATLAVKNWMGTVFVYEAKTTKADGGKVDLKLYYVRRYATPPGLRIPGEWIHIAGVFVRAPGGQSPGVVDPVEPPFSEELVEIDKRSAVAADGKLHEEMGASELPPWPGFYRVVATWPDADAPADDGLSRDQADLEVGTTKEQAAMQERVDREIYQDMARVGKVLNGLKDRWSHLGDKPDEGWAEFRKEAARKLDAVKVRNGGRRKAEIYWMEYQGKKRIELMMQKLEPALDKAGLSMTKAKAGRDAPEETDLAIAEVEENYSYYLNFLGFGRIIDDAKIDGALAGYRSIAAELKAWSSKAEKDRAGWLEASGDILARLMQQTVDLTGEIPEAFFLRAEKVSKIAMKMLDHVGVVAAGKKPAQDWSELESALDAAAIDLRDAVPRIEE